MTRELAPDSVVVPNVVSGSGQITSFPEVTNLHPVCDDREIIQALHEDAAGRLWIGVIGGLRLYQNGKARPLLHENVTAYDIRADGKGNHWVASDKGLFQFDDDKLVATYTTKDGLPSDDIKVIHIGSIG